MDDVQAKLQEIVDNGWSLQAIGEVLGVERESISRWYHGHMPPAHPPMVVLALDHPIFKKRPKPRRGRRPGPVANTGG